jgi:hypothetical protein
VPKTPGRVQTLTIATALVGGLASLEGCATGDTSGVPTTHDSSSIVDSPADAIAETSPPPGDAPIDSARPADADATPSDSGGCVAPETTCGGVCVSLASDPANCGACGNACTPGEVCSASACTSGCGVGLSNCGGSCVDLKTDPANCGACATPCASGVACVSGSCATGSGSATTVTFPSTTSTTTKGALGAGGSGRYYDAGDYVQEAFARSGSVSKLDVSFKMIDFTDATWCFSGTLAWKVMVDGVQVGTFSWSSGYAYGATQTITKSYSFPAVAPSSGEITLRYESTTSVCSGGGSWDWFAGGTATLE